MIKSVLVRKVLQWLCDAAALLLLFASPIALAAPTVTAEVPLNFGLLAVKANSVVSSLVVSSSGVVSNTGDIVPIGGAVHGQYRLSGFPPGVLLELQWSNATLSAGGIGLPEYLQVTNYQNPTLLSDALGEAVVPVGATLQTSASGVMYADAPYSGSASLQVRYWSAAAGGYLTHFDAVTLNAQLQSAFTLNQTQELSFGVVAAYSDPAQAASMTLAPNGSISNVTSAGSARIIPLGGAQISVVQVSGAAPNNVVTITLEAGNIFLTHVTQGLSSARFIVKNFVTSPSSPGAMSDSAGELQIHLGATLETEVTPKVYMDGVYSGTYTLTVTY